VARVSFLQVFLAESIKVFSLRSTIWCLVLVTGVTVGLGLLMSTVMGAPDSGVTVEVTGGNVPPVGIQAVMIGTTFTQLIVAVMGALNITGEYSTGMIKSTLTAVPARIHVIVAKSVVLAVTVFIVSIVSVTLAAILAAPLLPAGAAADLGDADTWARFTGSAGYLVAVTLIALGIGTIVRNGAAAISIVVGILFIVPLIVNAIPAEWVSALGPLFPDYAGSALALGAGDLEPWQSGLTLLAWVTATMIPAAILLNTRDA
jgi:ABC-2 type transport system permease protein